MRRLAALVVLVGCASMAPIPGGPEDHVPPRIVSVTPDTNSVNFHGNAVDFRFDEVVNDRSGPTQDLNGLFLISPRDGPPRINWHRQRIDVRPRGKWRPNTAYSVTLLPGLSDLSANITKYSYTVVFSTGPTLPNLGVVGRVFDWSAQRPAPNAVVEAIQRPDSVVYIAVADSTGQFHVGPFAPGTYAVIAFVDANKNMLRDPGEIWDSTQVKITDTQPMLEMLAAKRDTIGPAIAGIAEDDSVTLRVTFDKPLNPDARLDTAQFRILSADSARLTPLSVRTLAQYDTDRARARADSTHIADSLAAVRDTTKRAKRAVVPPPPTPHIAAPEPPKPSKPAPATVVMIQLALGSKLPPLKQFRVTATGMINLLGYKGTSSRVFATPKPPAKPDTTKAPGKPDSSATKHPPPPPSPPRAPKTGGGGGR